MVSQGLAPVPPGTSERVAEAITAGSHAAFMTGLHTTMFVAGLVSLVGAFLGLFLRSEARSHGDHPVEAEQLVMGPATVAE